MRELSNISKRTAEQRKIRGNYLEMANVDLANEFLTDDHNTAWLSGEFKDHHRYRPDARRTCQYETIKKNDPEGAGKSPPLPR